MSEYPYYGANYGNRDQTNPSYLPPNYQNPASYYQQDDGQAGQTQMNQAYDNTMSAYGYNQAYSAPALQTNIPPIPSFQGWTPDNMGGMSQYNPYAGYNQQNYAQNSQYYATVPATHTQSTYHSQTPALPYAGDRDMSEGEYDDGSAHMNNPPPNTSIGAPGTTHYRGTDGNGYLDTAQRAVYSQSQNPSPQQPPVLRSASDYYSPSSSQARRHPSGSYSPYVSQNEPTYDQQTKGAAQYSAPSAKQVSYKNNGSKQTGADVSKATSKPEPIAKENLPSSTNGTVQVGAVDSPSSHNDPKIGAVAYKSVAEARKKAEGAILNLWSYDVRYPAYLEEGVDEKLVGDLFDDLRLSRTASKSLSGVVPQESPITTSSASSSVPVSNGQSDGQVPTANLSIADKNKQTTVNGTASSAPAAATAPQPKSAAAIEKEKIMQMKMEALRKSREERAQKNAAKTVVSTKLPSPIAQSKTAVIEESRPSVSTSNSPTEKFAPLPTITKPKTINGASSEVPTLTITTKPALPQNQPSTLPQAPQKIPGLFLASNATTPVPAPAPPPPVSQASAPVSTSNAQRKRPVAADFDGPATSFASSAYKRPFGQSRNEQQPFVIDVSEDEDESDEDVAMDLESCADTESPVQASRKLSDQRIVPITSIPLPLKPFTPPHSTSVSTPPPQSATKPAVGTEDLRRKESEIEQLKRKIAEAELRKKVKKTSSGMQTPVRLDTTTTINNNNIDLNNKTGPSVEMQKAISIAEDKLIVDQQKLAVAQAAEREKAAEIQRKEAENKRIRLERIANAIPRVDAEALQNQLKLEQLRAETARVEAAMQKNLQDKQKLAEEMERLSREAEHQIQEKKEQLDNLTREENDNSAAQSRPTSTTQPDPEPESAVEHPIETREKSPSVPMDIDEPLDEPLGVVEEPVQKPTEPSPPIDTASITPPAAIEAVQGSDHPQKPVNEGIAEGQDQQPNSDQVLEEALQEAVRADADTSASSDDDIEMEDGELDTATGSDKQDEDSDYSPVLERAQLPAASQIPDPIQVAEVESDNYEPPDATPPADEDSPPDSPPFSPAPPEPIADAIDEVDDLDLGGFGQISTGAADDNEPTSNDVEEVLPEENGSVPQLTEEVKVSSNPDNSRFFTPYESPLKYFHAFRFHPEFKQQVAGGLKSMTYTHRIDAKKELCRYELMGGICNDHTCDLQHFREMGLPDDAVLTTLGSPDEFEGVQREKFIEGLKQVLSGLRTRKIKDFDVIASEIVAHRSKFLGDPSKVLMLEGTTI